MPGADAEPKLSLFDTLVIILAGSLGAGIFVLSGPSMIRSGVYSFTALLVTALLALIAGVCFSEIARFVSKEGGAFEYVREVFSPNAGFVAGLLWAAGLISAAAAGAINLAYYISSIFAVPLPIMFVGALITILAAAVVLYGVKLSVPRLAAYIGINIIALLAFLIYGSHLASFTLNLNLSKQDLVSTFTGSAIMFFAFAGFSAITVVSKRVAGGDRTIKNAIYISIIVFLLLYAVLASISTGVFSSIPQSTLPSAGGGITGRVSLPLLLANLLKVEGLRYLFVAISIVSIFGLMLICLMGAARVFFAMGRDCELPELFKTLNPDATPTNGVILACIAAIIIIATTQFAAIIDTMSATMLFSFTIVNVAALNLTIKERQNAKSQGLLLRHKAFFIVPLVGILGNLGLLLTIGQFGLTVALGVLLVSGVYYTYGKVLLLPKGMAAAFKESPETNDVKEFVKD